MSVVNREVAMVAKAADDEVDRKVFIGNRKITNIYALKYQGLNRHIVSQNPYRLAH